MLSFVLAAPAGAAEITSARELKAVFLFNFAQFTEWPVDAFADRDAALVIGILGADPFGSSLDNTVENETVRGRRIKVERYRRVTEIKNCHILYIGLSEADGLERVLRDVKGKPVLTVRDNDGSARQSAAMINFLTKQNKIRFVINLDLAREARLTLSSKLLRAAEEVVSSDRK